VIRKGLETMGLTVVSLFSEDTKAQAANPTAQNGNQITTPCCDHLLIIMECIIVHLLFVVAFICNLKSHWFTIRRLGTNWFNLNSLLKKGLISIYCYSLPGMSLLTDTEIWDYDRPSLSN
jgi:hypothetical protein